MNLSTSNLRWVRHTGSVRVATETELLTRAGIGASLTETSHLVRADFGSPAVETDPDHQSPVAETDPGPGSMGFDPGLRSPELTPGLSPEIDRGLGSPHAEIRPLTRADLGSPAAEIRPLATVVKDPRTPKRRLIQTGRIGRTSWTAHQ